MKSAYRSPRIVLLAGAMLFSGGAWALPPPADGMTTRSTTVKYSAAKVTTAAGAAELYARLRHAASRVCMDTTRRIDSQTAVAACMKEALDGAVARIGSPMLTALHSPQLSVPDAAVARR